MTTQYRPPSMAITTIGLSLATFMQVLDTTIANVSLPTIAGNLGVSVNQSTWVITSFAVSMAISLPLTGFLTRRFGEEIGRASCRERVEIAARSVTGRRSRC